MKSLEFAASLTQGRWETDGPNDGPILTGIRACLMPAGTPPCSWCALVVAWIVCHAYGPVSQIEYRRWLRKALSFVAVPGEAGAPGTFFVESCQSWWEWAMFRRMIVDHPQAGDLFIILDKDRHARHMGIVEKGLPEMEFKTFEGNSSATHSFNGDGFYNLERTANERTVFVRLPEPLRA